MPKIQEPTTAELAQTRSEVVKAVFEADEMKLMYFGAVLRAIRCNAGFTTPCENFILSTLRTYSWKIMTADSIQSDLEEFKSDFEMVNETVAVYAQQFPSQFKAKVEELSSAAE